jgi:hypothetical protein
MTCNQRQNGKVGKEAAMGRSLLLLAGAAGIAASLCCGFAGIAAQETPDREQKGLRGFVCDPEGKPIPLATVQVNGHLDVATGEDGTFWVPDADIEREAAAPLLVLVSGQRDGEWLRLAPVVGLATREQLRCARFVDYVSGRENVTLRLAPSAFIEGRVVTPDGAPIAGAAVEPLIDASTLTCHGTLRIGIQVKTDEEGRFRVQDLYPDTRYMLRVRASGHERKWSPWIPVHGAPLVDKVKICLQDAPGLAAGRVVDGNGDPVAGVSVFLGHPCIPDDVCVTAEDGRFRIVDLVPGEEVTLFVQGVTQRVTVGDEDVVIETGTR